MDQWTGQLRVGDPVLLNHERVRALCSPGAHSLGAHLRAHTCRCDQDSLPLHCSLNFHVLAQELVVDGKYYVTLRVTDNGMIAGVHQGNLSADIEVLWLFALSGCY